MGDVKKGDIAFSGKHKFSLFSSGVKFWTNSPWSHCFFLMGEVQGHLSVLEADLNCKVVPFNREYRDGTKDYYEIFRPIKASQVDIDRASEKCFFQYAGQIYGFSQIPWFMWRATLRKIGLDAHNNWSPEGVICSELLYYYLWELGGEYKDLIDEMKADDAAPQDLYELVLKRPDLFEFVIKKEKKLAP